MNIMVHVYKKVQKFIQKIKTPPGFPDLHFIILDCY